ncbi:hypothetical protein K458DRAFT_325241 [Lentithecium fluviatile CBS 122367]|uniref:Xylanolytic transcriptional activator regulatory domain-containing protein n=1 Tax=Lentithecium fluviatile CBS 122367 TaxID=1168545 RepID=A0A6G1JN73_9PLEO|nr:hypothetical protein K458DRAFT_325241 [Lentithecium fluviatile CBS 122367]
MVRLLRHLREVVGGAERDKIDDMLGSVHEDIIDAASTFQKGPAKAIIAEEEGGEANTSAEVGSNEDLDTMDEDLLRNEQSRATGYLGKNSAVQWLRRIHHEADTAAQDGTTSEGPYGPPGKGAAATALRAEALKQRQMKNPHPLLHTSSCSFYLDDETVDMDFVVDPFDLPPLETAERLLKCYMKTVQNSYPILAKKTFVTQFYHYYSSLARGVPYHLPQKWQAMLNLVFAIGAAYSHLIGAAWRADDRDHFLYHSRAWALSLKDPWWFSHPDLPQTQISGLLALYYLAIGHVNRSWIVIGMAVRFGVGLGLHVRNDDRTASEVKKEILSRIWWGLYSLERILCTITGRPSVGTEAFCSVAFPLPISGEEIDEDRIQAQFGGRPQDNRKFMASTSENSSGSSPRRSFEQPPEATNSGSYLTYTVKLGMITQKSLNSLYSPAIVSHSWKEVQHTIHNLIEELEAWAAQLPPGFNFYHDTPGEQAMGPEHNILRIYYYSAKILISRPCLCRMDRRIKNQTQNCTDFNQKMARSCVGAAKALATLLPNDLSDSGIRIYEIFPWWAAVHYIMQSFAVLMLEISYESAFAGEGNETIPVIKKLIRCLRALRLSNGMARRAYSIAFDLLQKMAIGIKLVSLHKLSVSLYEIPISSTESTSPPLDAR